VTGTGPSSARSATEALQALQGLLETAYGSAEEARAALQRALHHANRTTFPTSVPELLSFVRSGLLPVLSGDLGARLTITLVDEFIAEHEIRSGVRAKESVPVAARRVADPRRSVQDRRLRVLLVDTDRIRRSTLARALVRERSQVTAVESLEELGEVVRASDDVQVAVLDGQHPARLLLVEMILDRFPAVSLVVRSTGEAATRTLIQALGVEHFEVLPGDASSDAIVEAVRRLAAIPR
jgi:ActR/RegA family two-component response regulator